MQEFRHHTYHIFLLQRSPENVLPQNEGVHQARENQLTLKLLWKFKGRRDCF